MKMLERRKMNQDAIEIVGIDSLVPKEHLLDGRLYSEDNGRPCIDPVVLFKMVLVQHPHGLPSLRRAANGRTLRFVCMSSYFPPYFY